MDDQHFLANAAVRLADGGPVMQVAGPSPAEGRLWCTWTANGYYFGSDFEENCLVIVDNDAERGEAGWSSQ